MKYTFTLLILLLSSVFLFAQEEEMTVDSTDTTAPTVLRNIEYSGYRLYISNPTLTKDKRSCFKMNVKVTNTGSRAINASQKEMFVDSLIIKTEKGFFQKIDKTAFEDLVMDKIRTDRTTLRSGQSTEKEYVIKIPKARRLAKDNFTVNTGRRDEARDYSRDLCPDLIVDSLSIVKRNAKYAIISFQVKNVGKGAISVIGDPDDEADNIQVGAFFSGTRKYSKGALQAGSTYLKGLKETKGILFPGQSIKGELKVNRKSQSKYTKVLILYVDSIGMIIECNETNNYSNTLLR